MQEMDPALLLNTQAYLAFHRERLVPDSVLTLAWEKFFRIYDCAIRGYIRHCRALPSDVEDVVQDVWKEVVNRLPDFRWNANRPGLRRWLYKLVQSKAMDILRQKRRHKAEGLLPDEISGEASPHVVSEDRLNHFWRREFLHQALEILRQQASPTNAALIHFHYVENLKSSEVASRLGLTLEQVRYRRKRLLKKLRILCDLYTGREFSAQQKKRNA